MSTKRRIRSALTAAALLCGTVAGGVVMAAPASASASCPSGALNTWQPRYYDSAGQLAAIGYIYQYRDGACTYLQAQGRYYGMYKWMDVQVRTDTGETGYDGGHYYYYAGPVSAYSAVTGNLCMTFWFDMQDSAGNWVVNTTYTTPPCD